MLRGNSQLALAGVMPAISDQALGDMGRRVYDSERYQYERRVQPTLP